MNSTERLEGWAQIEDYLDLTRNTILARGYPVHKVGGLFAFCDELDEHAKSKPLVTSQTAPQEYCKS